MSQNRNPFNRPVAIDDTGAFESLAASLAAWEPGLELHRPPTDALLYEPDGTLYATVLDGPVTFRTDRREVVLNAGDAVVVPQAVAIDAGNQVDLLAIRSLGSPPDHFRERFIQVWGIDAFPAPPEAPWPTGLIPADDVRHRISWCVGRLAVGTRTELRPGPGVVLLVVLEGAPTFEAVTEGSRAQELLPRTVVAVGPGQSAVVRGPGRIGAWWMVDGLTHEARRAPDGRALVLSPEYRPSAEG